MNCEFVIYVVVMLTLFCTAERHLCCCRYGGQAKHIKIHHADDGSYYLASCHVFPNISVCAAASVAHSLSVCGFSLYLAVEQENIVRFQQ